MSEIPRYYLPKLFGGSHNAQRVITDPCQAHLNMIRRSRTLLSGSYYSPELPPPSFTYETDVYTRREFGGPQGTVVFYADHRLSNAEACDRVWRYLMRASGSKVFE